MIKPGYRKPKDLFKYHDHMRSRRRKDRAIKTIYGICILIGIIYYAYK